MEKVVSGSCSYSHSGVSFKKMTKDLLKGERFKLPYDCTLNLITTPMCINPTRKATVEDIIKI